MLKTSYTSTLLPSNQHWTACKYLFKFVHLSTIYHIIHWLLGGKDLPGWSSVFSLSAFHWHKPTFLFMWSINITIKIRESWTMCPYYILSLISNQWCVMDLSLTVSYFGLSYLLFNTTDMLVILSLLSYLTGDILRIQSKVLSVKVSFFGL